MAGLMMGFVGTAILASRSADSSSPNSIAGQIAVLVASVCYALNAITLRRYLRDVEPLTIAGNSLIVGAIPTVLVTLLVTRPLPDASRVGLDAVLAVITLALF
jgi:drug/metabolite transporter (DMT)-like permease